MDQNTLSLLEFPKILKIVSSLCLSDTGRKRVLSISPARNREEFIFLQSLLKETFSLKDDFVSLLGTFPPLEGVFNHISQGKVLDEDGLWGVFSFLRGGEKVYSFLRSLENEQFPSLKGLVEDLSWPRMTFQGLSRCIDPSGEIRDESSPELLKIRGEIRKLQKQCTKKVNDFLAEGTLANMLQDEYLTISSDRYVIALKANFKGRVQGIIHDYSQSGETCYLEPLFLVELNNRLQELKQREREEKNKILRYLTSLISQEREKIVSLYDLLVDMDILRAKLLFAQKVKASILEVRDDGINIRGFRHPLLFLEKKDSTEPVDILLKKGQKALLLTGGNSGGKTVCLKSLGLAALMALSGLPVPCDEGSSIPFWEKIYVFLGDEQSIEESLSTYTAQIKKLRDIWGVVDTTTLILLDEFGSGTDPSQGAALAQAVVDCLLDKGAWIFSVTHFPSLKIYGLSREEIRVASVLFDPESKRPLYKIAYDQIGTSQALDVAREFGLPREILDRAKKYLLVSEEESSRLISRLNSLALEREKEVEALQKERKRLEYERKHLREKYEKRLSGLVEEVSSHIRDIVRQWQEQRIQRKLAVKRLKEVQNRLRKELTSQEKREKGLELDRLRRGDKVIYVPWNKEALVEEVVKHKVKINVSGVSLWVEPGDIGRGKIQEHIDNKERSYGAYIHSAPSLTLDLRGKRVMEAEVLLRQFIDKAILKGRSRVEIIHGRGEGILREMVKDVLRELPGIKRYYFAPEDRGGDGVTIVEFDG